MKATTRNLFILSVLVSLFLFMGAGIFQVLETQDQEHKLNDDVVDSVKLERLRTNLSVNLSKIEFDNLVRKIKEYYKNRHVRIPSSYNWTYSGALYFSASVVTTIGKYQSKTSQFYVWNCTDVVGLVFIHNCTYLQSSKGSKRQLTWLRKAPVSVLKILFQMPWNPWLCINLHVRNLTPVSLVTDQRHFSTIQLRSRNICRPSTV